MDGVEQLKQDVRDGRVSAERLVELLVSLQRELQAAQQSLADALRRIEELEKSRGGAETVKFAEPFWLRAEELRQEARGKKKRKRNRPLRRGRVTTAEKIQQAQRTEQVFPVGVSHSDWQLSHTRPVWRLEAGHAVLVAYAIDRGPKNQYGKIPGVLGRGEFGVEIVIAIADQVHLVGLSFDKVCLLMGFFRNLRLRKSPVDALLNQLSRHWAGEFERLCTLLANSAVVPADETSWSINSVWAFLSEKVRGPRGCPVFRGPQGRGDTASHSRSGDVCGDRGQRRRGGVREFHSGAKALGGPTFGRCPLRKAIPLTLLEPANAEYRRFADRLLEIYRSACRVQRDGRLSDAGRAESRRARRRDSGTVRPDVFRRTATQRRRGQ